MLLELINSRSRLVKPDSDEIAEMLLELINSHFRLVKPDSDEISEIVLSLRYSNSSLVKPDSDEIFEMLLRARTRKNRLVKPDSGEIFEMLLLSRTSCSSLVKPDSDEIAEMLLKLKFSTVRRVANSSPVKSLMFAFCALRRVKVAISSLVIGAPGALPRRFSITARRFASGMVTTDEGGGGTVLSLSLTITPAEEILPTV